MGTSPPRRAAVSRKTKETDLKLELALSSGPVAIPKGFPGFFGHMLNTLATYAGWSLAIEGRGDLEVDAHHLVEDVGLVLGEALEASLGDFSGHARFGKALVPMDEALAEAALDAGHRPYLRLEAAWPQPTTGDFELCLVEEFFRALVQKAGFTLHLIGRHGQNSHHLCEAMFKAAGLAAREALAERGGGVFSTKGVL
ncbi:MAG: imidazoleglycerol-phosphate dehydratase HisB [Deltaproteobacteria bacterium]|jgi:imidazoleglycerol-phosphate dehydratase|nr:imidazoleglycerol-phosphate dehydratase HisB [Deltaproteobacteria bacterium]